MIGETRLVDVESQEEGIQAIRHAAEAEAIASGLTALVVVFLFSIGDPAGRSEEGARRAWIGSTGKTRGQAIIEWHPQDGTAGTGVPAAPIIGAWSR